MGDKGLKGARGDAIGNYVKLRGDKGFKGLPGESGENQQTISVMKYTQNYSLYKNSNIKFQQVSTV